MITLLLACGPRLDPASREPQRVEAPFGDVVALLPPADGAPDQAILVTSGGAVRIGARVRPVEVPPGPPITAAALRPDGSLLLAREGDLPGGTVRAIGAGPIGVGTEGSIVHLDPVRPPGRFGEGRFLMGAAGTLAVGGGPGPHGDSDGWLVSLDDRREVWVGGPDWEVLHAVTPFDGGWLAAGVGVDRKGEVEVAGALWVVRLDARLVTVWERRFHGGQDHVAAVVGLGDRAVVLSLGGSWDDPLKPLTGWVVRADGAVEALPTDLGRVRSVAAAASGPARILVASTDPAGHVFVRWVDVP